jgi:hypothetical protein
MCFSRIAMQAILGTAGTSRGQQTCHMTDSPVKIIVSVNVLDCKVQFTIVSQHAVKAHREGEVQYHLCISAALDRGGQLHVAAALILETVTCYPLSRKLDGPNNQSDVSEKRKMFSTTWNRSTISQFSGPYYRHYT